MDIISIANEIEKKIHEIDEIRKLIKTRGEEKATTIAEYDKAIAVVVISLKNGKEYIFENETISNIPATIMDKVSRGICWQEKLKMEKAEALYKSAISNLDCCMSQLNAYQSLFRHLENK